MDAVRSSICQKTSQTEKGATALARTRMFLCTLGNMYWYTQPEEQE